MERFKLDLTNTNISTLLTSLSSLGIRISRILCYSSYFGLTKKLIILVLAFRSAFYSMINFGGWILAHEACTMIINASLQSRKFVLGAFVQGNLVLEAVVLGGLCLEAFVLLQYLLLIKLKALF